jgi:hypothetical protein
VTGPPDPTAALNERFTLYSADGKPVERMLHEMTADEVMAAVEWSVAETKRLNRAAEPARELVIAVRKEGRGDMLKGEASDELTAAVESIREAMEATNRHVRLLSLIQDAIRKRCGRDLLIADSVAGLLPLDAQALHSVFLVGDNLSGKR